MSSRGPTCDSEARQSGRGAARVASPRTRGLEPVGSRFPLRPYLWRFRSLRNLTRPQSARPDGGATHVRESRRRPEILTFTDPRASASARRYPVSARRWTWIRSEKRARSASPAATALAFPRRASRNALRVPTTRCSDPSRYPSAPPRRHSARPLPWGTSRTTTRCAFGSSQRENGLSSPAAGPFSMTGSGGLVMRPYLSKGPARPPRVSARLCGPEREGIETPLDVLRRDRSAFGRVLVAGASQAPRPSARPRSRTHQVGDASCCGEV
jgi:hypothetical protein